MVLLREKGYTVQPFKCGPDYIDTKFHTEVCGRPSVNLDTFMATPEHVRELFAHYGEDVDVCVVEGMMGLFDGYDRERGSSYEIARALDIPVVLVVDAKSAAYSMTPLLQGFVNFRKDVRIAGVIFNKVGSEKHYQMLQQVCDDLNLRCFGYLPKQQSLEQGSRYLGLDFSSRPETKALVECLKQHVDWQALFSLVTPIAGASCSNSWSKSLQGLEQIAPGVGVSALIARNAEAFSFLYQETIDSFKAVRYFDPEQEVPSFDDVDLLYLPGGYPEKHVETLVQNEACRKAIKAFAEQGGRVVAECGGMMYLCKSIIDDEGEHPMCGVLPYSITARRADRKLSLGYRRFVLDGKEYRGHEFHYTQLMEHANDPFQKEGEWLGAQVYNAKNEPVDTRVFKYKNVLASYTHLYRPTPIPLPVKEGSDYSQKQHLSTPLTHREGLGEGLHPVMFAGTGSDVGKSIVAAAFCRIFLQDGYHPAPFKAQNMALNSYATPDGKEIGRAQAVQAEAAGIPCHTDMNPLLLKPNSDHTSQVVLHGKPLGNKNAYDFWREGRSQQPADSRVQQGSASLSGLDFRREVCDAFDRLAARYNPIVMEGAGSIAEINLKDRDLVNMSMARHANADVILVGDIDRGGVFASVYGSIMLQSPEDRKRIKGIIINKFRGDMRLFDEGRRMLEELCGIPVLGVIPYYKDIYIDEEDSVALERKNTMLNAPQNTTRSKVNVAVVLLRHISNFTDFNMLERDPRVNLFYTSNTKDIEQADIIILPGTKSTLDDLLELRRNGCAQAIQRAHRNGKTVVGICGGYQMLGQTVDDPDGIEGSVSSLPGLGLLPIHTVMTAEKKTEQVTFLFDGHECQGYEIHQGVSDTTEAVLQTDHCLGTYIHGFLDNQPVIEYLLSEKLKVKSEKLAVATSYADFKEEQYDKLAAHVRQYIDMERLYQILQSND